MNDGKTGKIKTLILLHLMLMFFSLCGICSKSAALQPFFSIKFFLLYGLMIFILGIYAIGWQQIIKRLPLTTAYANRAVTIIWGLVWGYFFFGESITPGKITGILLIVCGIVIYALSDKEPAEKEDKI